MGGGDHNEPSMRPNPLKSKFVTTKSQAPALMGTYPHRLTFVHLYAFSKKNNMRERERESTCLLNEALKATFNGHCQTHF